MGNMIEALRQAHKRAIAENPIVITISRTTKVPQGGAFVEQPSTVGPFTVRLFQRNNSSNVQEISTLAGTKQIDRQWGLLADYQADIQAGPNIKDEFTANGMDFLVIAVYPQTMLGQVVCFQVDLERVM